MQDLFFLIDVLFDALIIRYLFLIAMVTLREC